ncbi:LysR family transcriptional regulator [Aneurinibacillus sp. Ricciae_BoGa-3]|uniref:LysR family transcriptional regulator n=1 Tax=Aneurinibacillus sp. Ricciae_BoGa-3 TaxID=3022697 RepID=UPI002340FACB|nr:LysR family transcriptional regulator [Aneurinibacillus sp. Ricciae_BoGa-3]WCK56533.1 LysR family transcriptional regulator [Aneurinibacillus sp. Ricciae_BoGa-3]
MELLQLQYFRTVARLEHISKAAQELNIAQPSLSKTISRLEEDVGVPLFDRIGRQIQLNQYGRAFLRRVERIFTELEEGKRELADLSGFSKASISLAVTSPRVLPGLLGGFLASYPNTKFRQVISSTADMKRMLENSEVDFCISSPPIEGDGIESRHLLTEEVYLTVPPGHPLSARGSIDLREAAGEPFINMKVGYGFRDITDEFCRQAGFTPSFAFEGDEPAVIRSLVKAGLGVAFLPALSWMVAPEPAPERLHITNPVCQRTIGLAWLRGRYLSEAACYFQQYTVDFFARIQSVLSSLS